MASVDDMRIVTENRWVLGDDGRVKKSLVDVYRSNGNPVWLEKDKVFRTELEALKHALEVTTALSTKFGLLAEEHRERIQELEGLKVGDRVRDDDGDTGTVIALGKNGEIVVEYDSSAYGVMVRDPKYIELTKIED